MEKNAQSGLGVLSLLGILLGVVAVVVVALSFYCPCERLPGGHLLGREAKGEVADWSFANAVPLCQVEVRAIVPHSVNLNCMAAEDGTLYLSCAQCDGKRWSAAALADPAARLRVGDAVYPVRLTRIDDAGELDRAWHARAVKVGSPSEAARPAHWWSFRVDSR
jgi:hypothetical protein